MLYAEIKGIFRYLGCQPFITGRCTDAAFPHRWINFVHIILLDAWTLSVAVAAKTPFASVDIHAVQEKFCYSMTGTLCTLGKRPDQRRSISFFTWTAIENNNFFTHDNSLLFCGIDFTRT